MGVGGVITIFATYRAGGIPFLQYDTIKCNFSKNKNSTGILLRNLCLPAKLLSKKYDELNVKRELLARTVSDTGTIIAPLFPWNVNSLLIAVVTGFAAAAYIPFAVLCYISPIVTLIASSLKKSIINRVISI
ncbi:Na+/H+ antiporter family protein [Caloramator quimbayensis]|uniref:Na+/H+ antiporter family protein n=1 Tax=Caloramator quimbayensis TaxID=1147123 RepID=A0A1T4YGZ8_9CLOT|nr:Na+/H+ antiporter NhaC family protein [Caloramator quimbayensis]SKB00940.1 Na+/H+ antiporter family protein [Caloramator quimbayensis]